MEEEHVFFKTSPWKLDHGGSDFCSSRGIFYEVYYTRHELYHVTLKGLLNICHQMGGNMHFVFSLFI